ncbi:unnamed protein product [Cochlearia groenlandica]
MVISFSLTIFIFLLITSSIHSARLLPAIPEEEDDNPPSASTTPITTQTPLPIPLPGPAVGGHKPVLEFFTHVDVLGGSHPSARVVTGIVAQTEVNGIPFSKSNNNVFPVDNAVPLVNANNINNIINPNTGQLLTRLSGSVVIGRAQGFYLASSFFDNIAPRRA